MILQLALLTGYKRYLAAFGLGVLMSFSMPPVGAFPLLLWCVPGLMVLIRAAETRKNAFLLAWTFGAGYFIAGLYWISAALFIDIRLWGWVLPFSLILGPALFALWYGFIPLLAWRWRETPIVHIFMLVAAWAMIEWLRGHLLTGFPWNLIGYTWMRDLPVMQVSAYIGIYGLTLLTLLWAAIPALPLNGRAARLLGISFLLVTLFGMARLHFTPVQPSPYTVRVVQGNIGEKAKWSDEEEWRNLEKQAILSQSDHPVTYVVWPETAVTGDLATSPDVRDLFARYLPRGAMAVVGALRFEGVDETSKFYNSVGVVNDKGQLLANYDKNHLVPFGEYIPFRKILNMTPIASSLSNMGEFSRGGGRETLKIGDLPSFSPLICYEVVFPHEVAGKVKRPDWLVNVTNDAWYGRTAGPFQHFEIARIRAIEEGLPLVRAANTGISGVIDPLGRVLAAQPLDTVGAIETALPSPLSPTFYARWGDVPFLLMFGFMILAGASLPLFQFTDDEDEEDDDQG